MKFYLLLILSLLNPFTPSQALDEIVQKQVFKMSNFKTLNQEMIENLQVGYETYGVLNEKKTNAILITHYFSGNSHAAGKYATSDLQPGYWDSVIGPGLTFDTSKYFIISSDTLVNINPKDSRVITTGPLSINPKTKKPYGPDFPVVTFGDLIRVQKALVESLGITRLHAVAGPSAGSMQALQWAADFPESVSRVIAVISPGLSMPALSIAILDDWAKPIRRDSKFLHGKYRPGKEPLQGLTDALQAVTLSAVDFAWAEKNFGRVPTDPTLSPLKSLKNQFLIESQLQKAAALRAQTADANSFLYMVRLNQAFDIENKISKETPPLLFISVKSDSLFPPELVHQAARKVKGVGGKAEVTEIEAVAGHLAGLTEIQKASESIKSFLK